MEPGKIIIERHSVAKLDPFVFPEPFNSSNHPKEDGDEEAAALDYQTELKKTNLPQWVKRMNYPVAWTYTLTDIEAEHLTQAAKTAGYLSQRRYALFEDELQAVETRLESSWQKGAWFCRLEGASPKDGAKKAPYSSASDLVDALSTSLRAAKAFKAGDRTLYFVAFDKTWKVDREVRCFVYKKKLTAISQYKWFSRGFYETLSQPQLQRVGSEIRRYVEDIVVKRLCEGENPIGTDNMVVDLYVEEVSEKSVKIRFVECNSFGYWLASGSAMFHWTTDREKLYNTNGDVYFRVLVE